MFRRICSFMAWDGVQRRNDFGYLDLIPNEVFLVKQKGYLSRMTDMEALFASKQCNNLQVDATYAAW